MLLEFVREESRLYSCRFGVCHVATSIEISLSLFIERLDLMVCISCKNFFRNIFLLPRILLRNASSLCYIYRIIKCNLHYVCETRIVCMAGVCGFLLKLYKELLHKELPAETRERRLTSDRRQLDCRWEKLCTQRKINFT